MITKPDLDLAAMRAMQILIDNNITETPINPLPIMLQYPGVRVMPFTRMAAEAGMERSDLIPMFGANQDAATFHLSMNGMNEVEYVVVYNMRLPFEIIWRGIARELGHVVLKHDGTMRSAETRKAEAMCFAHHLLCPRPVIQLLKESGMPLTMNVLANTTGCSEECVEDMQMIPGVNVPMETNIKVRELFKPHINEYIRFHMSSPKEDKSPILDFGTYMDGYAE